MLVEHMVFMTLVLKYAVIDTELDPQVKLSPNKCFFPYECWLWDVSKHDSL